MINLNDELRVWKFSLTHHLRAFVFSSRWGQECERMIIERRSPPDFRRSPASYLPIVEAILERLDHKPGKALEFSKAIEIGTGRHLAVPLILRFLGMREITTIDIQDMLLLSHVRGMSSAIINDSGVLRLAQYLGVDVEKSMSLFRAVEAASSLGDILKLLGIRFIPNVDLRRKEDVALIADIAPEIIFSNNVLEHISAADIVEILRSIHSVFTGIKQMHIVDLGDHFADALTGLHQLHNYRYGERIWNILSGNRYLYTNRLTLTDYDGLMRRSGFEFEIEELEKIGFLEMEKLDQFIAREFDGKRVGTIRLAIKIN